MTKPILLTNDIEELEGTISPKDMQLSMTYHYLEIFIPGVLHECKIFLCQELRNTYCSETIDRLNVEHDTIFEEYASKFRIMREESTVEIKSSNVEVLKK